MHYLKKVQCEEYRGDLSGQRINELFNNEAFFQSNEGAGRQRLNY